ncbi:MAG TPA: hypothetical protein VHV78_13890 [Gemmatimonadaceae bacterium]|jgi:hypothetical protein|nr:hypothetical protein [Gemmatimonadaceae bacterium]
MTLGVAILSCALAAGTCHASADPGVTSYAVRVHAPAGSIVRLSARDVPRGWIASFCTPHVCSPFHVALPVRGGSATIQLSYVRSAANAGPLRAPRVTAAVL